MWICEQCAPEEIEPRSHGFLFPLDIMQPIALFAYSLFGITLWTLHVPLFPGFIFQTVACIVLTAWVGFSFATYFIAALAPGHARNMEKRPLTVEEIRQCNDPTTQTRVCRNCRVYMTPWAKHCYWCDKCVDDYDHHCRWLNSCVGARNYRHFSVFVANTTALSFVQVCIGFYFIVSMGSDWAAFTFRVRAAYGHFGEPIAVAFFLVLFTVVELVVLSLLGHLMCLHIYLVCRRKSTYMWIQEERENAAKRREERRIAGIPNYQDSPMCHALTLWRHHKAPDGGPDMTGSPAGIHGFELDRSQSYQAEGEEMLDQYSDRSDDYPDDQSHEVPAAIFDTGEENTEDLNLADSDPEHDQESQPTPPVSVEHQA